MTPGEYNKLVSTECCTPATMCRLMIHGRHSLYVVLTRATFFS